MKNLLLALLTSLTLLLAAAAHAAVPASVGSAAAIASSTYSVQSQREIDPKTYVVYVTKTGKKYHMDGCRYLRQSKIKTTLEKARKSYDPCKVCKPPS